ncbi:MAG: ABC transporter ATP-binding protein [Armatimonadetes bacterium]|nr:ABC transporter ATP-binding protein [Armatimonadota bacterium]
MTDLAIQTAGLTRRFGRVLAVDDVSLAVPAGSVYGYLGRNGAGKTTTIQMLMGLLLPASGTMSVMGYDPFRQGVAMKRIVSYVPERVHLPDWMTVRQLIGFGQGMHPHWDGALAEELRKRLDLPADRKIGQLSRGMQGKAALLSALASRPKLLILDDPTMGLDALVRREFMQSIVAALSETGTTVFFSSHLLEDVERVADRIGILHEGRLVVQSSLEELQAKVKRVIATFPEPLPEFTLPGTLHRQDEGRQQVWIVSDYSQEILQRLHDAGALSAYVENLSLEDIFVAYVQESRHAEAAEATA